MPLILRPYQRDTVILNKFVQGDLCGLPTLKSLHQD